MFTLLNKHFDFDGEIKSDSVWCSRNYIYILKHTYLKFTVHFNSLIGTDLAITTAAFFCNTICQRLSTSGSLWLLPDRICQQHHCDRPKIISPSSLAHGVFFFHNFLELSCTVDCSLHLEQHRFILQAVTPHTGYRTDCLCVNSLKYLLRF